MTLSLAVPGPIEITINQTIVAAVGGCTMRFCPTCRKPRTEGSKTCSGCGNPYPSGLANLEDIVGYGRGRVQVKARSLRTLRPAAFAALAIVVLVVLAGGTGAVWLFGRHPKPPATAQGPSGQVSPTSPAAVSPSAPAAGSPSPSASPGTGTGAGAVQVRMSASAAQAPGAASVAAFVSEYFTAINAHHYHAFKVLHIPQIQADMTRAGFNSGYPGTVDTAVRLVGISTVADGDTAAALTFTSHQRPNAADNEEPCTTWQISLFLTQDSGGYLIDQAPEGYQAVSAPC
jgi:hypothetical protein